MRSWLATLCAFLIATRVAADVVVLANRTGDPITVQLMPVTAAPWSINLARGETKPVFSDERLRVSFSAAGRRVEYPLEANAAYFFGQTAEGRIDLQKIGLQEDATTENGRPLPGTARLTPPGVVSVVLLVDEDDPTRKPIWEQKLRRRLTSASEIVSRHSLVGFKVVGAATWNSDNGKTDFNESLAEFEREVKAPASVLSIGFTSQYEVPTGRIHMGGTRGPLYSHILLREWSRHLGENERLELLVHELGHFMGASHSPERDSVMRSLLGDRQARFRNFEIRFDPVNTLAMSMVGEEFRRRRITSFAELTPGSKRRLYQIYDSLGKALPQDESTKRFVSLVSQQSPTLGAPQGAKKILTGIVGAALRNRSVKDDKGNKAPLSGDPLTELYVREAASSASTLPAEIGPTSFLMALGVGLDHSDTLQTLPITKSIASAIETQGERSVRIGLLGEPTMGGRRDTAQHFCVSAFMAAIAGSNVAETIAFSKEVLDAQGGTGFSFADLAADKAGIRFAQGVLQGKLKLRIIADSFTVAQFMPDVTKLPEGLQSADLVRDYGGKGDPRFEKVMQQIEADLNGLPVYKRSP